MSDISICEGKDCPLKENCYRYKAVPNPYRQSFFANIPYDLKEKKCEYFWEINKK